MPAAVGDRADRGTASAPTPRRSARRRPPAIAARPRRDARRVVGSRGPGRSRTSSDGGSTATSNTSRNSPSSRRARASASSERHVADTPRPPASARRPAHAVGRSPAPSRCRAGRRAPRRAPRRCASASRMLSATRPNRPSANSEKAIVATPRALSSGARRNAAAPRGGERIRRLPRRRALRAGVARAGAASASAARCRTVEHQRPWSSSSTRRPRALDQLDVVGGHEHRGAAPR